MLFACVQPRQRQGWGGSEDVVCMARAWGSEAKPLLAGATLGAPRVLAYLLPQAGQSGRGGVKPLFACSNNLKILDVSPIELKILYLISSPIINTSR